MKARTSPLVLEFSTWSLCLSVELNLMSWFLGMSITTPSRHSVWPTYELRIQVPTLMFNLEVITDTSLERAIRAQAALEREFPEDSSSTPQDEQDEE